jgi:hypothetical protein
MRTEKISFLGALDDLRVCCSLYDAVSTQEALLDKRD